MSVVGTITATPTGNQSVSGTIGSSTIGHAPVVIVGGSVAASFTPPANQSVSGAVQIAGSDPTSIVSVRPIDEDLASSAIALVTQGLIYGKTTAGGGAYVEVKVNPSGGLEVGANQEGTWRVSVISSTPSSLLAGVSVIGLTPINVTNTNLNVGGSVVAFQGAGWSGSVAAFQAGTQNVSITGAIAPTATITSVKATSSTTNLLANNTGRRGAAIGNYSGTSILLKLGNMATVNDNSLRMNNNDYYEVPFNYSGVIQHFASSTSGLIQVTEIT